MTQTYKGIPPHELKWGTFIADLGPTPREGIEHWLANFKQLFRQAEVEGTAIVNQVFIGRSGRVMLEVLAIDPDAAVAKTYALGDNEGPEVLPL